MSKLARTMYEEHLQMQPTEVVYKAVIPLNPVPKKNSQQIVKNRYTGKPMLIQSDNHKKYIKQAFVFLTNRPRTPIDYPINLCYRFYRDSDRAVDESNLVECIDDLLTNCGVIADDNFRIVVGHDGTRVMVDRDNPRTEIIIQKMEVQNNGNADRLQG